MDSAILLTSSAALIAASLAVFLSALVTYNIRRQRVECAKSILSLKQYHDSHVTKLQTTADDARKKAADILTSLDRFDIESLKKEILQAVQDRVDQKIRDMQQ